MERPWKIRLLKDIKKWDDDIPPQDWKTIAKAGEIHQEVSPYTDGNDFDDDSYIKLVDGSLVPLYPDEFEIIS